DRGGRDHCPRHPRRSVGRHLHRADVATERRVIRSMVIALIAAAAAISGEIGARRAVDYNAQRAAAAVQRATETRNTHEINVPRIKDGAVKGYAVMLLSYTLDLSALRTAAMAPDSILVDEAFRYVYNDDTIDFDHLDRFDFARMG